METSSRNVSFNSGNQQQVASVAFSLWEKAGRPQGRDEEFWFEAEKVLARQSSKSQQPSQSSKPDQSQSQPKPAASQTLTASSSDAAQAQRGQKNPREGNGSGAGSSSDRKFAPDKRGTAR